MKPSTQPQPQYRLIRINTSKFIISRSLDEATLQEIALRVLHRFSVYPKDHLVAVYAGFDIVRNEEGSSSDSEPFLSNMVELVFKVFNFDEVVKENRSGQCLIPIDWARVLFSIAIGTARGVCHAKTEGSYINRFFLPILDAHTMIQDLNGDGYVIVAPNKLAP